MANYRFGGYQYETSPRKLEPEYEQQKNPYVKKKSTTLKQKNNKQVKTKLHLKSHIKTVMFIGMIFSVLLAISYRNSLINESFNKNAELKNALATTQKENEQLKVNIANGLNLANIEKLAKEKLGMQKLTNKQIVYVSLPKKDYVESASEKVVIKDQTNWFEKLVNKIFNK